ncbi:hypothetical protein ABT013_17005 [Streptomyces bacillaris]|uniref:Secreted protein n=1 Tax=Streptomyces cavourensis TaxID=67258 RepID=A0ABY5FG73_9ACTN|nr:MULTISPECIES: hypothetical protein [Streptomyces]MYR36441.1 hypothetical protein [Streptomyces sp. SID4944]ALC29190.1 hypothetical protein ABE83_20525 [Streptomyces sp. CFMR 7]RST25054.1 hypothetical protein EF908_01775 [Streptomyces sp. WAC04770]UTR82757.1 hypothetical protein NLU04_31995 [Streptomyces cavourensis]WAE66887.1 hypothetical protein OUQ49_14650 [Streptomyces cavourensis]
MTRFATTGGVVVAALAAALTLTACGSDDDGGKGSGPDAASSAKPGDGQGSKGSGVDAAALEGTWVGLTDGKNVTVSITAGKVALVADQAVCQGDVKDMGEVMLALKCTGGSTDRTMGAIESNDGKKLVLSWDGGVKDTLSKAEQGKLPTDLPSLPSDLPTDLPTDLPSDLPTLPEMPELPSS